jgi:hypothetical protein
LAAEVRNAQFLADLISDAGAVVLANLHPSVVETFPRR